MAQFATKLIKGTEQDYIDRMVAEGVEVVEVEVGPYMQNALEVMKGQFPEWTAGLDEETLNSLE